MKEDYKEEAKRFFVVKDKWSSTNLIGKVKEVYDDIFREDRRWNVWRAFYNGWIEGRANMLSEIKEGELRYQPETLEPVEKPEGYANYLSYNKEVLKENHPNVYSKCVEYNNALTLDQVFERYKDMKTYEWRPIEKFISQGEFGNWDGLRSDFYLLEDSEGFCHVGRCYSGFMDGSEFAYWYDKDDMEIRDVVRFKKIKLC